MSDYRDNDPRGWCGDKRRGAALGRPTELGPYDGSKLVLQRVRIDAGGYDPLGTYYGIGEPLYWCASEDGALDFTLRAASREAAKEAVRARVPGARFYR